MMAAQANFSSKLSVVSLIMMTTYDAHPSAPGLRYFRFLSASLTLISS